MLSVVLELEGFRTASAFTYDLRDGVVDLATFMNEHQPRAVIYDIAPPYDANWELFESIRANAAVARCEFVITSTNARHVQRLAGADTVYEILGKPYDLGQVVSAVKNAIACR